MPAPLPHPVNQPQQHGTGLAAAPKALQAVRNAKIALGKPYIWGGTNLSKGVDCSGLCYTAYSMAGASLPRTSQEQWQALTIAVPKGKEIPGDLIFSYPNEGGVSGPGHVVMSLGNGRVIAADHTGSVVHEEDASIFDSVYVGSKRVVPFIGAATGPSLGGNSSGEGGVVSDLKSGFDALTSTETWIRVGEVLLGFALVIMSIYLLVKQYA